MPQNTYPNQLICFKVGSSSYLEKPEDGETSRRYPTRLVKRTNCYTTMLTSVKHTLKERSNSDPPHTFLNSL